jgi:hypothetical protein
LEEEADNLSVKIYVCIRAKIMLTTNFWSKVRLANSSMGTIHNMSWYARQDILSMPSVQKSLSKVNSTPLSGGARHSRIFQATSQMWLSSEFAISIHSERNVRKLTRKIAAWPAGQ